MYIQQPGQAFLQLIKRLSKRTIKESNSVLSLIKELLRGLTPVVKARDEQRMFDLFEYVLALECNITITVIDEKSMVFVQYCD